MNENERENAHPAQLACPSCGSVALSPDSNGELVCDFCHTVYVLPDNTCSECGTAHPPNTQYCPTCGTNLMNECRMCGALNPLTSQKCTQCGQDVDMLGMLFTRTTGKRADWLQEVRQDATKIKARQQAVSETQRAEMWKIERRRREKLAEKQAERDRQQRIMFTILGVIIVLIVVGICVTLAISFTQTPSPLPSPILMGPHYDGASL